MRCVAAVALAGWLGAMAVAGDTAPVGREAGGRMVTPVGQFVTPLGRQVDLAGLRPQSVALSPDGHNWSSVAIANEYLERSFAGFPRSYPDGLGIPKPTRWLGRPLASSGTGPSPRGSRSATTASS